MTISELDSFTNFLLKQLEVEDKKAISTIDDHKEVIEQYLSDTNSEYLKKFVNDINTIIVEGKIKKFKIFEKVLNHLLFTSVLTEFRNSDVLIRACKAINKKAAEWLLTMNLNYDVQGENGATALMESAFRPAMNVVFEKLIKSNVNVNIEDNNGNNALFYATKNQKSLDILLKKTNIDINHLNHDNDSVFTYCCRMDRINAYEILSKQESLNPNHINCIGKTAAMYLVEHAEYQTLKSFIMNKNIDPNYKNKFGETLVSCFVKKFYQHCNGGLTEVQLFSQSGYLRNKRYANTFKTLIEFKCDFNVPVDDDGNTPIMVFLMMKDYVTCKYLLKKYGPAIDLSKKNYNGINASYLSLFISSEVFESLNCRTIEQFSLKALKKAFTDNPTFDRQFLENGDITSIETIRIINKYKVPKDNSKLVQQWLLEAYFPKAMKSIEIPGFTNEFAYCST